MLVSYFLSLGFTLIWFHSRCAFPFEIHHQLRCRDEERFRGRTLGTIFAHFVISSCFTFSFSACCDFWLELGLRNCRVHCVGDVAGAELIHHFILCGVGGHVSARRTRSLPQFFSKGAHDSFQRFMKELSFKAVGGSYRHICLSAYCLASGAWPRWLMYIGKCHV